MANHDKTQGAIDVFNYHSFAECTYLLICTNAWEGHNIVPTPNTLGAMIFVSWMQLLFSYVLMDPKSRKHLMDRILFYELKFPICFSIFLIIVSCITTFHELRADQFEKIF